MIINDFKKWLKPALAVFIGLFVFAELAYWLGARHTSAGTGSGNCVVLVAGFPANADGSLHPMQRMRVEVGMTAYRNYACDRLIVSGAAAHNEHVEAKIMAAFARELGISDEHLIIEDRALNTWQNVSCSLPFLENHDRIFVASDTLHIHRAKHYLCRQKPAWCDRVQVTGGHLPLGLAAWAVPFALHELYSWARDIVIYERSNTGNVPFCPDRH